MSRREAKLVSQSWVDDPSLMASDLRNVIDELKSEVLVSVEQANGKLQWSCHCDQADTVRSKVAPMVRVLSEYRRMLAHTTFNIDLFVPLLDALDPEEWAMAEVPVDCFNHICEQVTELENWADIQKKRSAEPASRSELLKSSIEFVGDEIILQTDKDGSIKLRGASNIPMFLAFWRARKHRLNMEAFLDIDRRSNPKGLERHRTRLCAQLQNVLLEVVAENDGFRMQKCK